MAGRKFDFTITERRSYTIKLEACNANYTGVITAQAQPLFSREWDQYPEIPFGRGEFLRTFTQPPNTSNTMNRPPLINPVLVQPTNLSVLAAGKSISITVPFGATYDSTYLEFMNPIAATYYYFDVWHNGAQLLLGFITVGIGPTNISPPPPAAFSICDAKAV